MRERPQVRHSELMAESRNNIAKKLRRRGSEDNIVDVEEKIGSLGRGFIDEKRGITAGSNKTNRCDERVETLEPGSWSLFEAVERLAEEAYVRGMGRIFETEGLLTVHGLADGAIEKGVFDV
jgi:hypothetical protein